MDKKWSNKIEKDILKFWNENKIYEKWRFSQLNKPKFNFLEGPPYTTGSPHLGHLWNRSLKDIVLRYKAKKGYFVWVQSGFDMHGLPIEEKVEKKLNIKNKKDIEKIGIEYFIKECKKFAYGSMLDFTKMYEVIAHWQDTDNPYLPIANEYIEKVWSLFKKAYEKGLLYEGEKPVWWCPRCQTPMSKQEIELGYMDAMYQQATDPSIYVKFRLKDKENTYLIIWTTTPWTLTFNLGVMVNPDIEYTFVEVPSIYLEDIIIDEENKKVLDLKFKINNNREVWIIAKDLVEKLMQKFGINDYKIIKIVKGYELEGLEYIPPFYEELKDILDKIKEQNPNAFTAWLSKEYVSIEEGTGLVHSAPGCGPEDYEVAQQYNVKPFNTVDDEGFARNLPLFEGWRAKYDDLKWVRKLIEKRSLIYFEFYKHDYPICWRCRNRLIIRATKQWFINVQKLKEGLISDLEEVNFIPEFAKDAFKNVIKSAPDWVVSRQRYWGIPLPIWKCENGHIYVVGSIEELKKLTGKDLRKIYLVVKKSEYAENLLRIYFDNNKIIKTKTENLLDIIKKAEDGTIIIIDSITDDLINKIEEEYVVVRSFGNKNYEILRIYNFDLHRPYIDSLIFKCPICNKTMKRIQDVIDVWIDSGSATFATNVYPVDFIVEGIDQLRGWFYALAILGKIYYGKIPYKNVYVHGFVLDSKGLKMSKSLGNVIEPKELIEKYGADAVRFYLSSSVKAYEDVRVDLKELENKFSSLNILWNIHNYLIEQARYYGINPKNVKPNLRWEDYYMLHLLEKTKILVKDALENYELWKVGRLLESLYLELSRFYIKLTRERLQEDPETVLWVIYKVLLDTINMLSIVTPFISEAIFQNLKNSFGLEEESIHLLPWPEIEKEYINEEIEKEAEILKQILETGLRLRDKIKISLRWPLPELYIEIKDKEVEEIYKKLEDIIKTKLNVKKVNYVKIPDNFEKVEETKFALAYNTKITEELEEEGYLRELQRELQEIRKKLGLRKGEKIIFIIETNEKIRKIIDNNINKLSKVTDSVILLDFSNINVIKEFEFSIKEHKVKVYVGYP